MKRDRFSGFSLLIDTLEELTVFAEVGVDRAAVHPGAGAIRAWRFCATGLP